MRRATRARVWSPPRSAFAGFRFPADVITIAVRWHLRYDLMPLSMSSRGWWGACLQDDRVGLAGDVAFQAADGFAVGLAFGDAPFDVGPGAGVPSQTGQRDDVERGVGLPVVATVESSALGLPDDISIGLTPQRERRKPLRW